MDYSPRFTPGPWDYDHGEGTKVRDENGGAVASISFTGHGGQFGGKRPVPEPIANAKLIAAAPELFEAARLLEEAELEWANCEECGGEGIPELCGACFPKFDDARCLRRVALAKATGQLESLDKL